MAVDYNELAQNLRLFYDFTGKTVLYVGAGGHRLLDSSIRTKWVIAIDQGDKSLANLRRTVARQGRRASVEVVAAGFEEVAFRGDVVYFEFCLHEMAEPRTALEHAGALAPDIVVLDHRPGSEWAFYAAEDVRVKRSAVALSRFGVKRRKRYTIEQRFGNYAELSAKLNVRGAMARRRAQRFEGATNIVIPMSYELVLLRSDKQNRFKGASLSEPEEQPGTSGEDASESLREFPSHRGSLAKDACLAPIDCPVWPRGWQGRCPGVDDLSYA